MLKRFARLRMFSDIFYNFRNPLEKHDSNIVKTAGHLNRSSFEPKSKFVHNA